MIRKIDTNESKVEVAKREGRYLRGTIAETLDSDSASFGAADVHQLKFHGTYQQDDRDRRRSLRDQGAGKAHQFMVRAAIPAGVLNAEQYLALDTLGRQYADGSLRVTTRQGVQLHGVLKGDLKRAIARINQTLLTTLSACGDVGRNVMCCPAPLADSTHETLRRLAREIAVALRPASRAYHEIWLDEERVVSTQDEEPFYGPQYLPRKFKTGIAPATDNCVDIFSYDCGLIALIEDGQARGFNVVVGGGMGMTHGRPDTFAKLAEPLGRVSVEHAVETVRTVAAIFRDFGNRADRRHARLKYLIAEMGIDRFRREFLSRVRFALAASAPLPKMEYHDHLGHGPQGDGRHFYGVFIESGRIIDRGNRRLKTALRTIVSRHRPGIRFTPGQNLLLTDLPEAAISEIERTLIDHGVQPVSELAAVRRYSMACPALPTCGLALAESERVMPKVLDRFECELDALGLANEPITLRMTGCPNGCARPYTADIAFVGRRPDEYHIYIGGGLTGDRMADLYAADAHTDELVELLRPLLQKWAEGRRPNEGLGDFYQRKLGRGSPRVSITGDEQPTQQLIQLEIKR